MTTGRINQVSHRICCVCSCQPITRLLSPPRSPSAACTCTNSQSDYSCTHTLPSPTAHRDRLLRLPASSGNHTLTPPPRCPLDGSAADTSPLCRLVDQRCLPHRISLSRTDSTRRRHAYSPDASPSRNCAYQVPGLATPQALSRSHQRVARPGAAQTSCCVPHSTHQQNYARTILKTCQHRPVSAAPALSIRPENQRRSISCPADMFFPPEHCHCGPPCFVFYHSTSISSTFFTLFSSQSPDTSSPPSVC